MKLLVNMNDAQIDELNSKNPDYFWWVIIAMIVFALLP